MPLTIRMTDQSVPQSWILPDATVNSDGVMTAAQVRALNALGAPGAWVPWADLGLQSGFSVASAPQFQPAQSRLEGDIVRIEGVVQGPGGGGVGDNAAIVQLPVGQRPSAIRYLTAHYKDIVGSGNPVVCEIGIDDAAGTGTGTPGLVLYSKVLPANLYVFLDGLTFVL